MRLHPITKLLLVCCILRLGVEGADILVGAQSLANLPPPPPWAPVSPEVLLAPLGQGFAEIARSLLMGLAAVWVEGLIRIWEALRAGRLDALLGLGKELAE